MLDAKIIEIIQADFPEEAVQVKKTFKNPETGEDQFLTGYRPQYVFGRLNEAFGHDGWDFTVLKHGVEGKDAWVLGRFTGYEIIRDKNNPEGPFVRKEMFSVEQFGTGSYNKGTSLGDAMKGASSNALEKCASLKDIGHKAYKGLQEVPKSHPSSSEINKSKTSSEYNTSKTELLDLCREYKIDKKSFPTLVKTVLQEDKTVAEMSAEEITALVAHVKENKGPF